MVVSKRVVLHFPRVLLDQPIIYRLATNYHLEFNILKASVTPKEEGLMVLELRGDHEDFDKGLQYLTKSGVETEPLSQNVIRNDARCTHCGACVAICSAGAFEVEPITRLIRFDDEKCIACGLCIRVCPLRAMEVRF